MNNQGQPIYFQDYSNNVLNQFPRPEQSSAQYSELSPQTVHCQKCLSYNALDYENDSLVTVNTSLQPLYRGNKNFETTTSQFVAAIETPKESMTVLDTKEDELQKRTVQDLSKKAPQKNLKLVPTLMCDLQKGSNLENFLNFFSEFGKMRGFRIEFFEKGIRLLIQYQNKAALQKALEQFNASFITNPCEIQKSQLYDPTINVYVDNTETTEEDVIKMLRLNPATIIRISHTINTNYLLYFYSEDETTKALSFDGVLIQGSKLSVKKMPTCVNVYSKSQLSIESIANFFRTNCGDLEIGISKKSCFKITLTTAEESQRAIMLGNELHDISGITVKRSLYNNKNSSCLNGIQSSPLIQSPQQHNNAQMQQQQQQTQKQKQQQQQQQKQQQKQLKQKQQQLKQQQQQLKQQKQQLKQQQQQLKQQQQQQSQLQQQLKQQQQQLQQQQRQQQQQLQLQQRQQLRLQQQLQQQQRQQQILQQQLQIQRQETPKQTSGKQQKNKSNEVALPKKSKKNLPNQQNQQKAKPTSHKLFNFAVYVGNIPSSATNDDLKSVFWNYNPIGARIIPISSRGRYGFVGFASEEDQISALSLDGAEWDGQRIICRLNSSEKLSPKPSNSGVSPDDDPCGVQ